MTLKFGDKVRLKPRDGIVVGVKPDGSVRVVWERLAGSPVYEYPPEVAKLVFEGYEETIAANPVRRAFLAPYTSCPLGIVPLCDHSHRHLIGKEVEVMESGKRGLSYVSHNGDTFYWPTEALADKPLKVRLDSEVRLLAYTDEEAERVGSNSMYSSSFAKYRYVGERAKVTATFWDVVHVQTSDGHTWSWPLSALEVVG